MANTGLRPDEAMRLEVRDVAIIEEPATQETILALDVRGKVGVRYAISMLGAVVPFQRLMKRRQLELEVAEQGELKAFKWNALLDARRKIEEQFRKGKRKPTVDLPVTTRVFLTFSRYAFNELLRKEGLKRDRDGQVQTAYSLRHTYISTRLMESANIHQVANNCGTSVKMIEEHYGPRIKDRRDAASLNIQRPAAAKRASKRVSNKVNTPSH